MSFEASLALHMLGGLAIGGLLAWGAQRLGRHLAERDFDDGP